MNAILIPTLLSVIGCLALIIMAWVGKSIASVAKEVQGIQLMLAEHFSDFRAHKESTKEKLESFDKRIGRAESRRDS